MQVTKLKSKASPRTQFRVYCDNGIPLEDINEFLRYQEKRDYSPNTVKASAYDLVCFFGYLDRTGKDWSSVKQVDLIDYIHFLRFDTGTVDLSGFPASGMTRSESTISRMISSISGFYKYQYHATGVLLEDASGTSSRSDFKSFLSFAAKASPLSSQRKPIQLLRRKKSVSRPKAVSDDVLQGMVEKCANRRDRLLVLLLQETGMRIGQVLQLKHEDIESWNSRLKIVYRLNNPHDVYAKSRDEYYVDLSAEWIGLYTDYLIEDCENFDSEFVFISLYSNNVTSLGKPLGYYSVKDLFKRLSRALGCEVTPHMLRHTHATALLRSGVAIELVSKRLGHKSIETTKTIYEHLTAADLRAAIDKARTKK
jgi:site-specific recombinase XerD